MSNPLLGNLHNKNFVTPDGIFTQDELLIAKMLNEYNSTLSLVLVESYNPLVGEKPAAVLVTPHVGNPYVLMFIERADINYHLFNRVVAGDMSKQGRPLEDQLRANELGREMFLAAKHEEEMAEGRDLAKSILKSKLHAYRHKGKVYR